VAITAPSSTAVDRPTGGRRVTVIVVVLSLAIFMSSLDTFIVNLAFPYIGKEYAGTSLSTLSWVLNAYTIVLAAVLVPAGRWADRIGRRRVFVAGLAAFGIGSLSCGIAPSVAALIAARVLQAFGAGMMVPASLSLLLGAVPPAARVRAIGTWSAFGALGAALGPVIGGSLVQFGWRWVFWINLPVAVAAVVLAVRLVPDSRDEGDVGRPDLAGAGVLALSIGLLALGLVEAPGWGWDSSGFVGLILAALATGGAVVVRSRRHHSPVLELSMFADRTFTGAVGASVLYYAAFGAWLLALVEFLTGVWHYSPVQAGLAIAPGPLMVFPFARSVAPRLTAILGNPGRVAAIGAAVNAGSSAFWLTHLEAHSAYLTHLLPAQLIGGIGVGLAIPSLLGAGTSHLHPARFGTGSGIVNMARQIGTVIGVAALIGVLSHVSSIDTVEAFRHGTVLVGSLFASASLVAVVLLVRRPAATPSPVGELAVTAEAAGAP
jgi:EmrB/QacA subfamily drug resistance transporter